MNSGKTKVNDPAGPLVAGLKAFDSLRTAGCFNSDATTAKWTDSLTALLDGKTAFVAQNSDSISQLDTIAGGDTKKVDDAIGFVAVSATKQLANYAPTVLGTFYAPKTGDATKERAAADFIDFITGKGYADYVRASGAPPTLSGTPGPQLQGLWQQVQAAYGAGAGLTVISQLPGFNNFGPEVDKLLAGQETLSWAGPANFRLLGELGILGHAIRITVIYAVITMTVQNTVGLALAVALERTGRVNTVFRSIFFVPVLMSPLAAGYIWSAVLSPGDATTLLNVALYLQYGQSYFGQASALGLVVTALVVLTAVPLISWLRRREVPM